MRVGLVAPPWISVPPKRYGGTESVIASLARGLVAQGHDVVLATTAGSSCPVPRVPGLPSPPDPRRIGVAMVELPYVLAAYRGLRGVDVIHDHTLTGPLAARPPLGVPVVTTNHGPFDAESNPVYREMANRGVAVVAISRDQARRAKAVPVASVIHHGMDVAREAHVPLRIAAKMQEPAEREYFEREVRPLLGSDVHYVGELGAAERNELLRGATALLNPLSWPEPFGLVMIEALACGTPVVATPCGAAPEIVDDGVTGFLRSGIAGLAEALRAAGDLDRDACRAAALSRFTTSRMVRDHVRLYERLLRQHRRQTADLLPYAWHPPAASALS
jgi:glycosyltransferase involved in cell wall biosynthesis